MMDEFKRHERRMTLLTGGVMIIWLLWLGGLILISGLNGMEYYAFPSIVILVAGVWVYGLCSILIGMRKDEMREEMYYCRG